jgi:transaldolase
MNMSQTLKIYEQSTDHSNHIFLLTLNGLTRLAADHILHKEMVGNLEAIIGNVIRALNIEFQKSLIDFDKKENFLIRARAYDLLIQIALNLYGLESKIIGFSKREKEKTLKIIENTLKDWEYTEKEILKNKNEGKIASKFVIEENLSEMKKVMSPSGYFRAPGSMISYMAENIEKGLKEDSILLSFLSEAKKQIEKNIYYKLGEKGFCKFGNDYALGLRWMRHLGFVQVSTNPSLAAIAYLDDPSLWEGYEEKFYSENLCRSFKKIIEEHPELLENPEKHGDELAAYGTEVSIWPNLAIFRPIAINSNMFLGMVSLQLNPTIADSYEKSIKNALKIYSDAQEFFKEYDKYLLWGYSQSIERGRPNIVFKVAGSSPAAINITSHLESLGIGTNNTVTFTVSQEVELILAKIEGRAKAIKKGILLTTVYETNMGGRFEDFIREYKAEKLIRKALERINNKEQALNDLAEKLGIKEVKNIKSIEEKIIKISSHLRPLDTQPFIDFLYKAGVSDAKRLTEIEKDISQASICITKRVYEIFFHPKNRLKWLKYIQSKYGLTKEQAYEVLKGIHVLPASKRKPAETLETLANDYMVHTEFPNHQKNVLMESMKPNFKIEKLKNSVMKPIDQELISRLIKDEDIGEVFRSSWELTPNLIKKLKEAKILNAEKYGTKGLTPEKWAEFGSTIRTMNEFSNSYEKFKKECIEHIKKWFKK